MMENLVSLWDSAHPHDIEEGCKAYERYNKTLHRFAEWYGFGIVPTVEAFAALSPNNDYHGNLRSLASVLQFVAAPHISGYKVSTYRACAERAITYLTGEVSFLDTVIGPKIRAFRHNLLYPDTSKEVTVDGHMLHAWLGTSGTMKDAASEMSLKRYRLIAADIQRMARAHKLLPHQVQAALWITRKRQGAIKLDKQQSLFHAQTDLGKADVYPKDYPPYPTA